MEIPEIVPTPSTEVMPDWVGDKIEMWCQHVPQWKVADNCREDVHTFLRRTTGIKQRLNLPLIVATLGGTGAGKSTLTNALLGAKIVKEGRERPTTHEPVLVCHPSVNLDDCGLNTTGFLIERHDLPVLQHLILIDCPDPDTTENVDEQASNLARLRAVMPQCDVLIVTATQQKYHSRRVSDELATAATGARLIFVQTHADRDTDIREDWAAAATTKYDTGYIYFIDSVAALQSQQRGESLPSEFEKLRNLLIYDLNTEMALRIRQANYVHLAEETVKRCRSRLDESASGIKRLQEQVDNERLRLGEQLAVRMRSELTTDRAAWELRLISGVIAQWGYSPFSLVLRIYQNLGLLTSSAMLARVRSVPQLAIWGAFEGARTMKRWAAAWRQSGTLGGNVESFWTEGDLRESTLILAGYVHDVGISTDACSLECVTKEAEKTVDTFLTEVAAELDTICQRLLVQRNTLPVRILYESLLVAMLCFLLARPAYNFFIGSVFYGHDIWPFNFYIVTVFWLVLWCAMLLLLFIGILRMELEKKIKEASEQWSRRNSIRSLFSRLQTQLDDVVRFRLDLDAIQSQLDRINAAGQQLDKRLGKLR